MTVRKNNDKDAEVLFENIPTNDNIKYKLAVSLYIKTYCVKFVDAPSLNIGNDEPAETKLDVYEELAKVKRELAKSTETNKKYEELNKKKEAKRNIVQNALVVCVAIEQYDDEKT
eukprot:125136_1